MVLIACLPVSFTVISPLRCCRWHFFVVKYSCKWSIILAVALQLLYRPSHLSYLFMSFILFKSHNKACRSSEKEMEQRICKYTSQQEIDRNVATSPKRAFKKRTFRNSDHAAKTVMEIRKGHYSTHVNYASTGWSTERLRMASIDEDAGRTNGWQQQETDRRIARIAALLYVSAREETMSRFSGRRKLPWIHC